MLVNTRATFDRIFLDFKRFAYSLSILLNSVYIATMVYALAQGIGNTYVNAVLCAGSSAYFVFYLVTYWDKTRKKQKKTAKRIFRWFKVLMSGFNLGISIYGIYIASEHATVISILLAAVSGISWLFQVITALIIEYVENRKQLIVAALAKDFAFVTEPVNKVQNVIRKIKGEEPKEPKTVSEFVEKKIDKIRESFLGRKKKTQNQTSRDESYGNK